MEVAVVLFAIATTLLGSCVIGAIIVDQIRDWSEWNRRHGGSGGMFTNKSKLDAEVESWKILAQRSNERVETALSHIGKLKAENNKYEKRIRAYQDRVNTLGKAVADYCDAWCDMDQTKALVDLFTYEKDGRRFTGMHGDADVTDDLAAILGGAKSHQSTKDNDEVSVTD